MMKTKNTDMKDLVLVEQCLQIAKKNQDKEMVKYFKEILDRLRTGRL